MMIRKPDITPSKIIYEHPACVACTEHGGKRTGKGLKVVWDA
jgi:hypothetical protein